MNFKLLDKKLKEKRRKKMSIKRLINSFYYAIDGIKYSLINEQNLIIHTICAFLVVIFGFIFKISVPEWLFILVMIGLVISLELINTSIEAIVDLTCPEQHPLAKIAKDTGSGAVFVLAIISVIGAMVIFLPKIF